MTITQAEVQRLFNYNPETGVCTWKIWKKERVGTVAGRVSTHGLRLSHRSEAYELHRLIWLYVTGNFPESCIDHINGDPLDNRWCNLRAASKSQNGCNRGKQSNSTSGFKGICKSIDEGHLTLKASIQFEGVNYSKKIRLSGSSRFKLSEGEAMVELVNWLKAKRLELHKEFANNGDLS